MATIRTWTNETSLIEMDTNTYEKLEEILYMESEVIIHLRYLKRKY